MTKLCSITGCNNEHLAKGFCRSHYYRQYNERKRAALAPPPEPPSESGLSGLLAHKSSWERLKSEHEQLLAHYEAAHADENLIGWHRYYASYCQREIDIFNGEEQACDRIVAERQSMSKRKFYPLIFLDDIQ